MWEFAMNGLPREASDQLTQHFEGFVIWLAEPDRRTPVYVQYVEKGGYLRANIAGRSVIAPAWLGHRDQAIYLCGAIDMRQI